MAGAEPVLTGGCLCGAVRYRIEGAPLWSAFCHCESCRRATGAPVTAYAGFKPEQVTFTQGTFRRYASSPGVSRGFCGDCGSPLTFESERWPGEIHIHLGTLDTPEALAPQGEAFAKERIAWLKLQVPGKG
jgi:hypothetical protein